MQAIEFESVVQGRSIPLPGPVPLVSGQAVRVVVMYDVAVGKVAGPEPFCRSENLKALLFAMPDVGEDGDFARPLDLGREASSWDS